MVLSEAEAEARLAALRREREALDRAIADLTLFLELGRRLTGGAPPAASPGPGAGPRDPSPSTAVPPGWAAASALQPRATEGFSRFAHQAAAAAVPPAEPPSAAGPVGAGNAEHDAREAMSAVQDAVPEGTLARRYGRALIREAVAVLAAAGRPLHAGEILSALAARGFSVPGQDPVAALNTRLWKRAAPGGPLKRLGDAIYALHGGEGDPGRP